MKCFWLVILLLTTSIASNAQTIEKAKLTADSVLASIVGNQFFENSLRYNCKKSATIVNNTYWFNCEPRSKKLKRTFRKQRKRAIGISYLIAYDYLSLDTLEGLITFRIDNRNNIAHLVGITPDDKSEILKSLTISKAKAIDLANNSNFETGIEPWLVDIKYQPAIESVSRPSYYWIIANTLDKGDRLGCNSHGETLNIDAVTGTIIDRQIWSISCSH